MKLFLPITLGVVCLALAYSLYKTKKDDTAQHNADVDTMASYSNRLDAATLEMNARGQTILSLSNNLNECSSASLALSNQLTEAQSVAHKQSEQISSLNEKLTVANSEKLALDQQRVSLTNQVAALTNKLVFTEATLSQANEDYARLDNRLRRDIAARVVAERRFSNPAELQTQIQMLKTNPPAIVTADAILAGLNIEVKSNGLCYVIAPD